MTAAVDLVPMIGSHTIAEWLETPEREDGSRLDLIWGYWHVSPAPSALHQNACSRIWQALDAAITRANRHDLYVVQAVAIKISTAMRYGLIPDVVILAEPLLSTSFSADVVELAVEVWSPGSKKRERDSKIAGYANAQVPYLWTIEVKRGLTIELRGYELGPEGYRQVAANSTNSDVVRMPGPIPVEIDVAHLVPLR